MPWPVPHRATNASSHAGASERSLDALITETQRQIDLQYANSDALDSKVLGLMAVSLASAALVAAVQPAGSWLWAVPFAQLIAALACFVRALRIVQFHRGPDIAAFYAAAGGTALDVKAALFLSLLNALDGNERLVPVKSRWYVRGLVAITVALVFAVMVAVIGRIGAGLEG